MTIYSQSSFGFAVPTPGGEVQWSRDYWRAMDEGRLEDAYSIAYAHQDDFDWTGEYPSDWSAEQIDEHSISGKQT